LEVVQFLIGHNINSYTNNKCAFRIACSNGHLEIVKFLIEDGADIHANNDSALKYASKKGHLEIVELIGSTIQFY